MTEKDSDFLKLCELFNLSPFHWRWQLSVEDGVILTNFEEDPLKQSFRLGGPFQPSIACTRLAAMISLSAGKLDDALRWAHQAGTRIEILQAEIRLILAGRKQARRPLWVREMMVVDLDEKKKLDAALARARAARAEKAKTVMH
ncbi:MAG: hypothetical protein DPW12_14645 [Rhodocyclaceae bacterium]|nr:hypothetical protein [Bacteroidia bacterium]MCQ3925386.1 hypothetical protein [Rhodocyclaceae bacterium]HNQ57810.1 hypothetical protein [Candidatus Desulfobacillus denitrificans]